MQLTKRPEGNLKSNQARKDEDTPNSKELIESLSKHSDLGKNVFGLSERLT